MILTLVPSFTHITSCTLFDSNFFHFSLQLITIPYWIHLDYSVKDGDIVWIILDILSALFMIILGIIGIIGALKSGKMLLLIVSSFLNTASMKECTPTHYKEENKPMNALTLHLSILLECSVSSYSFLSK
jgi:hypothetical protein